MRRLAFAAALLLGCGFAAAQDEAPSKIEVNAIRNPEMRSYRAIVKGLDTFDEERALAPQAPGLRFRVQVHRPAESAQEPLQARVATDTDTLMLLPIDAQGRFTVPRHEAAYDAKADLLLNRKKRSYRIRPEVRSAGLPDNVRRLGDLRLECKVLVAIAKEEAPFYIVLAVNSLLMSGDWCASLGEKSQMSFRADAPLASAVISHGERSMALKTTSQEFTVPIAARDWPDDALVRLEYAAPAP